MMKPMLKLAVAVSLALSGSQAFALELGQIRVKSALDEPLVAEIPLQLKSLDELKGLSVELAPDADFAKAGLSRAALRVPLQFSVVSDSTGHKVILVTSGQPVADPYLDFLIQVNTAKGRQVREYTVLLDPVINAPAPQTELASAPSAASAPAPVEAPPPQPAPLPPPPPPSQPAPLPPPPPPSQPAPLPPPPPSQPAPVAIPAPAPSATANGGQYGPVQKGQTLYSIARQERPDDAISVNQMMIALQRANRDAFIRDNINLIKRGAILRIPGRDEIAQTSRAAANAAVHRQVEDWRGMTARKATVVAQAGAPANEATSVAHTQTESSDHLALVPPTQGGGNAASRPGVAGGTGSATIAGLKQQIATAQEALTSAKQENAELNSRVKDLEDITSKNQKLLGMKDAEIAELQRKLADLQKQQSAQPAAAASTAANVKPAAAASAASATSVAPAKAGTAATPASATTAAPTKPSTVAAQPAAVAKPEAPAPVVAPLVEELPWYRQTLSWVIGAIVILALILLGLLRRKPKPLPELGERGPSVADQFGASPLAHAQAMGDADAEDAHLQSLQA